MNEVTEAALKVLVFLELITLAYGVFCCITTDKIFTKSEKNKNLSYIPIYNLIVLIDIVKLSKLMIILLFVPVTNIIVFGLISYRLSIMYNIDKPKSIGLILLPIVFMPLLNYKWINNVEIEKEYEDVKDQMVTLLSENELNNLNVSTEENKVDNVFKSQIITPEEVPAFKANQNTYLNNNPIYSHDLNDYHEEKIEPVEIKPIETQNVGSVQNIDTIQNVSPINTNKFVNANITQNNEVEDKDIEILSF